MASEEHGGTDRGLGVRPEESVGLETRAMMDSVGRKLFGEVEGEPVRLGRFVILHRLGEGAMGLVYLAYDPDLDRHIAAKVLRKEFAQVAGDRMLREGRALAKLTHPNVVTVYEVGRVDGQVFVAMEYVEGGTLRQWMKEHPCRVAADVAAVLDKFIQAAEGLAKAHAAGIVHRDFKPDNVLLDAEGNVRVADFGLAAAAADPADPAYAAYRSGETVRDPGLEAESDERLTRTGEIVGTPVYMSPEQLTAATADARSDQYAFCVALYEALYGERPVRANKLAELRAQTLSGPPRSPPQGVVPGWIARVVMRGLSRDPADRFEDMQALIAALRDDPSRRRLRYATGIGIAMLLGGTAALAYTSGRNEGSAIQAPCDGVDAGLASLWNDDLRSKVEHGLVSIDQPWAKRNAELTLAGLDRFARAWVDGRRSNCEATRVRSEQSEGMFDRREACYRRAASWMTAATQILSQADAQVARRSIELVAGLPPVSRCADVASLGELAPIAPELVPEVDRARAAMAHIDAALNAGAGEQANEEVQTLLQSIEVIEYPPLQAEARQLEAEVLAERGDYESAAQSYEKAFELALGARHDDVLAGAAVGAFDILGPSLRRVEDAEPWRKRAEAAVDRLASGNRHRWSLTALEAELACRTDDGKACISLHERALEEFEASAEPEPALGVKLQGRFAAALLRQGESARALGMGREVLAQFEAAYGPSHPSTATARANLALNLQLDGQLEQARGLLERAVQDLERTYPDGHDALANAHGTMALILMKLGEHEDAARHALAAQPMYERSFGPQHPLVASTLRLRGRIALAAHRYEEAVKLASEAIELRKKGGSQHTPDELSLLGEAQMHLGQLEDARISLEQAVRQEEALDPGGVWSAAHHEKLARVHLERGALSFAGRSIEAALAARANEPQPDPGADRIHATRALIAMARGDTATATEHFEASLASAHAQTPANAISLARAHLGLARIARDAGDLEDARAHVAAGSNAVGDRPGDGVTLRAELTALSRELGE